MQVVRAGPDLTEAAAGILLRSLAERLRDKPRVSLALSGGRTPWPVLRTLARADLEWNRIDIYQVAERVAPDGDPARHLTGLTSALLDHVPATFYPMPVEGPDLVAPADRDAEEPPQVPDVVPLDLGDDARVLGPLQMLGMEHRISAGIPIRRLPVQGAPLGAEQRGAAAVAHQRMGQEEILAIRPDPMAPSARGAVLGRRAAQRPPAGGPGGSGGTRASR